MTSHKHKRSCTSARCGGCLSEYSRAVSHNTPTRNINGVNRNGLEITPGLILDFEAGELDEQTTLGLFQYLVDTGIAWQLQGSYGRTAECLIQRGLIEGRV